MRSNPMPNRSSGALGTSLRRGAVAVAVLAFAAVSPAGAQTPQPTAGGGASGTADAQVGFQRKAQLTPQEQLLEADRILTRMEQAAAAIRRQLEEARKQRDVVKTLCLNDKLSQIDVAIRSARDRKQSLQAAAQRNDVELSSHEFTILTVLRQRGEQLTAEANQCIGEEAAFLGDTKVSTTIDPSLPQTDDTYYPPTDPTLVSATPTCTSCAL
jgi:hypothetical protein